MWGLTEIVVKFIYDEFFQNDSFQFLMSQKDPNANLRSVCYRYEKMANVFFLVRILWFFTYGDRVVYI